MQLTSRIGLCRLLLLFSRLLFLAFFFFLDFGTSSTSDTASSGSSSSAGDTLSLETQCMHTHTHGQEHHRCRPKGENRRPRTGTTGTRPCTHADTHKAKATKAQVETCPFSVFETLTAHAHARGGTRERRRGPKRKGRNSKHLLAKLAN